jgi:hypothetical protein
MPMPIEKLIPMLNAMNIPKTVQYRHIPGVVVRLKNEFTEKQMKDNPHS